MFEWPIIYKLKVTQIPKLSHDNPHKIPNNARVYQTLG